jgi:uncharacterized membrane protein YuzA (DUF378 family)
MIKLQPTIDKIILNPKLIFLIDGFGAILSVFLLGFVLVQLENIIGMPSQTLYILAGIAGVFSVYSFFCAFRITKKWKTFLKIIALANLFYCLLTFLLLFYHHSELTSLGIIYFILEMILIVGLAIVELKIANSV